MTFFFAVLAAFLALPVTVYAAPQTFSDLVKNSFIPVINTATGVLVVLAIVIYFGGVTIKLFKTGGGKISGPEWGRYLMMGIFIIALMVSIVGVVAVLENTFFG